QVAVLATLGLRQCKYCNNLPAAQWIPAYAGMTIGLMAVAGCTVGPDYERPAAAVPAAYKEAPQTLAARTLANWQVARPADASDRGQWWGVFRDPVLDGLERQID